MNKLLMMLVLLVQSHSPSANCITVTKYALPTEDWQWSMDCRSLAARIRQAKCERGCSKLLISKSSSKWPHTALLSAVNSIAASDPGFPYAYSLRCPNTSPIIFPSPWFFMAMSDRKQGHSDDCLACRPKGSLSWPGSTGHFMII